MFNHKNRQKSSDTSVGFTIIEVMIVLAIAGVILLIVFLAVPKVQQQGRNYQRKQYAALVAAALSTYAFQTNGRLPACSYSFPSGCSTAANEASVFMIDDMPPSSIDDYSSTTTSDVSTDFCHGEANPSQSVVYCWDDRSSLYIHHDLAPQAGQIIIAALHECGSRSGGGTYGDQTIVDTPTGVNFLSIAAVVIGLEGGTYLCINN